MVSENVNNFSLSILTRYHISRPFAYNQLMMLFVLFYAVSTLYHCAFVFYFIEILYHFFHLSWKYRFNATETDKSTGRSIDERQRFPFPLKNVIYSSFDKQKPLKHRSNHEPRIIYASSPVQRTLITNR